MQCEYCGSTNVKKQVIGLGCGRAYEYICDDCGTVQEQGNDYEF